MQTFTAGAANRIRYTVINRTTQAPITAGTVNGYLQAMTGDNAGKWFRGSDQTWQSAAAIASVLTHDDDGHWYADILDEAWTAGVRYSSYAKESGDLHVPVSEEILDRTGYILGTTGLDAIPDTSVEDVLLGFTGQGAEAVNICNQALAHLGDLSKFKRMTAFTRTAAGDNTAHHAALDFYESAKKQMHGMMDWRRTRKVAALMVHADAPTLSGKWSYKYVRPADCFIFRKLVDTSATEYEWDEINEATLTNVNAEYIYANQADALGWYTILVPESQYMAGMEELHSLILAQKLVMTVSAKADLRLALTRELQGRVEDLCMGLGATETYIENERGTNELTDLY
jgi:hypothetical protein